MIHVDMPSYRSMPSISSTMRNSIGIHLLWWRLRRTISRKWCHSPFLRATGSGFGIKNLCFEFLTCISTEVQIPEISFGPVLRLRVTRSWYGEHLDTPRENVCGPVRSIIIQLLRLTEFGHIRASFENSNSIKLKTIQWMTCFIPSSHPDNLSWWCAAGDSEWEPSIWRNVSNNLTEWDIYMLSVDTLQLWCVRFSSFYTTSQWRLDSPMNW